MSQVNEEKDSAIPTVETSDELKANPGSDEAKRDGCICPAQDNNHGQGIWMGELGRQFVVNVDCPLHRNETPSLWIGMTPCTWRHGETK